MSGRTKETSARAKRGKQRSFATGGRIAAGFMLGMLLVVGVGGWAATAQLSGAVIARGSVGVDRNLKAVQHRDGGIIGEIAVREGDAVEAGQILFRLQDAQTQAELSIVRTQISELTARRSRLLAERDDMAEIPFPEGLAGESAEAGVAVSGERRLFAGNRSHRESQKQQLELQVDQIGEEIEGLQAQLDAKAAEATLVGNEYDKVKSLFDQGLVEALRVYNADRERARLNGERGEIVASIARARTRTSEIRLQVLAIDDTARTEAQRELSAIETRLSELLDRRMAIEDRLLRTEIRAPISGTVNELNVHTVGGVVMPAEVLVTIVPSAALLKVEAKIPPVSIDQVATGQSARLRFSTFNQRTTPELIGSVARVSPATTRDGETGEVYYLAQISIDAAELDRLGDKRMIPGMPVEVFITTEERTALSYIAKPVTDQLAKAFRER